ncbi:MAG: hypothetical protein JWN90_630 [Parcubacteria group bacterium]|nr:hypothetical protein [Parcubacteria group bacterium]
MRRVHAVHTMRLIGRVGLSLVVFSGSLYAIGREVWVARIFQNMPSLADFRGVLSFFFSAFRETHTVVQLTLLLSFVATLWLAGEIASALRVDTLRLAY